jgi:divalent metal cation (Fe/Co/Zn/Cd) transporter
MGFAAISLIREGISSLEIGPTQSGSISATLGILAAVVVVKAALFTICYKLRSVSSSCAALAVDHLNDVVSNSATLIAVGLASAYPIVWWLDPAACIILSAIMLFVWAYAGREQALLLTSTIATPSQLSNITYIAFHTKAIIFVDTVMAYSVGSRLQVEVDIGLERDMPLFQAHDIGEALTLRLEKLDDVERAFVHLDFEFEHKRSIEHVDPYTM